MALIVCHECGKRVSDTSDICIHCGVPLKKCDATEIKELPNEKEEKTEKDRTAESVLRFNSLGKEEQRNITKAFLKSDKISKKYRDKLLTNDMLIKIFTLNFLLLVFSLGFLYFGLGHLVKTQESFILIALFGGVIAILQSVFMFIFIFRRRILNRNMKRLVFEKKFQTWLMENKGISYNPVFINEREKRFFESLKI